MKKLIITCVLALIGLACLAQHKPPRGKQYPAVGDLKPLYTVGIYNRLFIIKSYPFATSKGGQAQYEAVSLGNYRRIKKGQVVCIFDRSVQIVKRLTPHQ